MAESSGMQDEGLVRVIGTGALGLSVVNMVVGAGIFVLPGLVAAELGSAAVSPAVAVPMPTSRKHSVRLSGLSRRSSSGSASPRWRTLRSR